MSKDIYNIKTELTAEETMQNILNKINDSLESITGDVCNKDDDDRNGPPHDLRVARVINELSQSYAYLAKNK